MMTSSSDDLDQIITSRVQGNPRRLKPIYVSGPLHEWLFDLQAKMSGELHRSVHINEVLERVRDRYQASEENRDA